MSRDKQPTPLELFQALPRFEQFRGPWAMHPPEFAATVARLRAMDFAAHVAKGEYKAPQQELRSSESSGKQVAVMNIDGVLTKQGSSMSYGMVEHAFVVRHHQRDPNIGAMLLRMDTPGGSVLGAKDFLRQLQSFAKEKPLWVFAEDMMCSLGVYLSTAATRIIGNGPEAIIGSIGTYNTLTDESRLFANEGTEIHLIRAGEPLKGAGADGKVTPELIAQAQRIVDTFNDEFLNAIEVGRGLSSDKVKALNTGEVWFAEEVRSLGLIDAISTFDDTLAELSSSLNKQGRTASRPRSNNGAQAMNPATLAELKAALPGASAEFLMAQLENEATVDKASAAYLKHLGEQLAASQKQVAELTTERDTLKAELAAEKAKATEQVEIVKAKGSPANQVSAGDDVAVSGTASSAKEEWFTELQALMEKKGFSAEKATRILGKQKPELIERVRAEARQSL